MSFRMFSGIICRLAWLTLFLAIAAGCSKSVRTGTGQTLETPIPEDSSTKESKITSLSQDELLERGNFYLKNDNLRLAGLHFSVALDRDPDSAMALAGLGVIRYRENQIPEATRLFQTAIARKPENATAMLYLGKIARDEADLTNSLKWLEKAVKFAPDNPEILTELAITNDTIGQERLLSAEPLYRKVVNLLPHLAAPYNNLGFNLLLQGRYPEAIETFSKALTLQPENSRTKNNLATAFLLIDQPDKALALFENTVGKAAAYNNLGYILMTQGNWDQAEAAFRKALNLNPTFYVKAQQNLERLKALRTGSGK
ncbi:MAG: tetratricopeptide repeat protein [Syntrophotaleaceae bacterium]